MSHYRIDPIRIKVTGDGPLAKGGQGVIVVATLVPAVGFTEAEQERSVAVKKIEWSHEDCERSTTTLKSFVNELSLMASLSHPNIIELLGFVENGSKGDAWIIMPWEGNGNVREFLQSGQWDIPERVSLIQDTANGLEYLHSRNPPVCHGDLKSLNILVNSSYRAIITDFGSARARRSVATDDSEPGSTRQLAAAVVDDVAQEVTSPKAEFDVSNFDFTLTGPGFSLRWTAPEVLDNGVQDLPSDITEGAIIMHAVKGKMPAVRENAQLSHILKLCGLMSECWNLEPANRLDALTFQRKVGVVPSTPPSPAPEDGPKLRSAALLQQLGTMHRLQDDWPKAESHFRSAVEIATRTNSYKAKGDALQGLGSIYRAQSRHQDAETSFREAHEIHSLIGNKEGIANALDGLGEVYCGRFKYREAENALQQAYEIYMGIGEDMGAANALESLGNMYRARCRNQEAEKAYREAQEIQSRIGNDMGAAHALVGLGEIYSIRSKYEEAEKAFEQAQQMLSRIGDEAASKVFKQAHEIHRRVANNVGAANALHGLGQVSLARYKYPAAEKFLKIAHEIHCRKGNDLGAANVLDCLAHAYHIQSRYQEAEKAFTDAHEIYSRIGNELGEANALAGLGRICCALSKHPEAEQAFNDAYKIHSRIGDDTGAATALHGLGETYHAQSKYLEAERTFKEAHAIYSRIGVRLGEANALRSLGYTHRSQFRDQEAELVFMDAHEIYSRIGNSLGVRKTAHALKMLRDGRYKQELVGTSSNHHSPVVHVDDGDGAAKR
ncbi:hypothetical protein FRC00_008726 [Tulasnella sp. 408]|nr:hypothetical protein FRC00_008726 [Tulasnella sp. 408]